MRKINALRGFVYREFERNIDVKEVRYKAAMEREIRNEK